MNRHTRLALFLGLLLLAQASAQAPPTEDLRPAVVQRVREAASALLQSLTAEERARVLLPLTDEHRARWSNLPTGIFERRGLRYGDMSAETRAAWLLLLRATLSERGAEQVLEAMEGDEVLRRGSRAGRIVFGRDEYYLTILGQPSEDPVWMWQFGGHHLAINATIAGAEITLSPSLTGGQPVDFEWNGRSVRQLGPEEDLAASLLQSLSAEQRAAAHLGPRPVDLAFGPRASSAAPNREGLPGSQLHDAQKAMLEKLIRLRVGMLNDIHADAAMKPIRATLDETTFAWFGATEPASVATFRIQGPRIIIEYSPQMMGGDGSDHTHAMFREPGNDYGARARAALTAAPKTAESPPPGGR